MKDRLDLNNVNDDELREQIRQQRSFDTASAWWGCTGDDPPAGCAKGRQNVARERRNQLEQFAKRNNLPSDRESLNEIEIMLSSVALHVHDETVAQAQAGRLSPDMHNYREERSRILQSKWSTVFTGRQRDGFGYDEAVKKLKTIED